MRMTALGVALATLAIAFAQSAGGQSSTAAEQSLQVAPQVTRPSWRVPAGDPARGGELAATCLQCHRTAPALAEPLAPKLNHQRESYIFFALLAYRDGERTDPVMTPWAQGLSDQDARDLAAALSGPMFDRPPVALVDDPAYPLAARECLWCHGETGIGEFEGMPVLAGQDAAYLARALAAYRDGSRTDPTMAGVAAGLSNDGIDRLAKYYAGHQWLERNR